VKNGNSMLISRVKQVYLYIFSNFNEEWNSEVKKILSKEEFLIFSKMKKYDKVHSYNLYQKVKSNKILSSQEIYLKLALLHDSGKGKAGLFRRIKKVKTGQVIKETYSDESLEMLRDFSGNIRDLAMIDLLSSTGMRVGELVKLNISDVDFENRECVVLGKGDKERRVYFDARTKIHLARYIKSRNDDNEALFVSLLKPHSRLKISGVEIRLRELGRKLNIPKVHPHKFRRTLATRAIDKGMPIEQVQKLLGHTKIDTTLQYAMVNQSNVKNSHRKYIG